MSKKVWVVSDSEPVPQLTGTGRLMRAGMLAEYFAQEGAETVWWASTWLHWENRFYANHPVTEKISDKFTIKLLHARKAYKKHISIARILYCLRIAKEFRKSIVKEEKPDVIVCSWPLMTLGYICVRYGKKNNIPVVLDIRDLWPEIFVQPFSGIMRKMVEFGINSIIRPWVSYAMKNATQVIGVSTDAVNMAYRFGRIQNKNDQLVPLSYKNHNYSSEELKKSEAYWNSLGLTPDDFLVVFIGSIQLRIAKLDVVLDAARKISNKNIKFIFCGGGTDLEDLKKQSEDMDNIIFTGYVNAKDLYSLGHRAQIGLLPYANTPDFINSLPNKLGEYLSYGLLVLTSLKGDSRKLLEEASAGCFYKDAESLLKIISNLCKEKELLVSTKQNALKLYSDMFNADSVYVNYCKKHLED